MNRDEGQDGQREDGEKRAQALLGGGKWRKVRCRDKRRGRGVEMCLKLG